jgi:hypothetical protein
MAIDENSAFTRTVFDLPTPVAIELDRTVKASGKSKKQWLTDAITAAVNQSSTPKKGRK